MKLLLSFLVICAALAISMALPYAEPEPHQYGGFGGFGGYGGYGGRYGGYGGYRREGGGYWGR